MATASSSFYKGSDDLDLTCDVCQHQNKTSIAVSYCETCEEALCQTCDNVHRNLKLTRNHSLLTGDQLIDIKLEKQLREFGNVQDTSHVNDSVPDRKKGTSLSIWNAFRRIMGTNRPDKGRDSHKTGTRRDEDSEAGPLTYSDRDSNTLPSVLDLTVSDCKRLNVGCEDVLSVVFMPSGHVVLACGRNGLNLLDKHFKPLSRLSLYSDYVCKVSDSEVLVSQGGEMIQLVEVLPKMVAKNVLTIGKYANGVCYHNGEIYAACRRSPRRGEIRVMKKDGTVVRRLGFKYWSLRRYMFTWPHDEKVYNAGDKVFVTDWDDTDSVICMDQKGRVLYKYTDTELRCPTGILVDRQDNVLVTTECSNNVHVINKKGRKHKIVLTGRDGLWSPSCISYRHDDGLLAIGMWRYDGKCLMTVKTSLA